MEGKRDGLRMRPKIDFETKVFLAANFRQKVCREVKTFPFRPPFDVFFRQIGHPKSGSRVFPRASVPIFATNLLPIGRPTGI